MIVIIPCSSHSSHSRLVNSGSWMMRSCDSLNPPSSSLKVIIFRATWEDFECQNTWLCYIKHYILYSTKGSENPSFLGIFFQLSVYNFWFSVKEMEIAALSSKARNNREGRIRGRGLPHPDKLGFALTERVGWIRPLLFKYSFSIILID